MGRRIPIRCFQFNPTVKSSSTFLRKTPWARKKVEDWFIEEFESYMPDRKRIPTDGGSSLTHTPFDSLSSEGLAGT